MIKRGSRYLLALLAVLGVMAVAPNASAYTVGSCSSATAAPTAAAGGQPIVFTAVFKQPDCTPFPGGVPVTFSQASGPTAAVRHAQGDVQLMGYVQPMPNAATSCQATFNPVTTTTDANGVASTIVTLPPGCPGQYVLLATAAGDGSVSVTVTEVGTGFPNTASSPPTHPGVPVWLVSAATVVLLVVALGATAAFMQGRRSTH